MTTAAVPSGAPLMGGAASPHAAPLLALLVANAVSLVGSRLTLVALPWFVLQTTGSASATGLVGAVALLPVLLAIVLGGPVVDRLGFKRASIVADVVSGLGIAAVPLLYAVGGLSFGALLALVFVGGLLAIPGLSARRSLLPELATLAGARLERVNAAFEGVPFLAQVVGPALAGVLIVALGAANVLWLDAASFAVSAALVAVGVPRALTPAPAAGGSLRGQLVGGLRFLLADRLLLLLALTLTVSNFFGGAFFAVLAPVYVADAYGSAGVLGLLGSAFGTGLLLGAVGYGAVGHRLPRRALWLVAFLALPLDLWALALRPPLPPLVVLLVIAGLLGGAVNPLLVTIRHERIPMALRGQVFSTFSALSLAVQPVGIAVAGAGVDRLGFEPTVLLMAAAAQALGLALPFVPTLRQLEHRPAPGGRMAAGRGAERSVPRSSGGGR
jgi:MFS family permease